MLAPQSLQSDADYFNYGSTENFVSPSAGRNGSAINVYNNFHQGSTNFLFGAAACVGEPNTPLLTQGSFGMCAKHPNGPPPAPSVLCQHHQQQ